MNRKFFAIAVILCTVFLASSTIFTANAQASYEVWVCMAEDGEIRIIDSSTNEVVSVITLTMGTFPWRIDFTPDGLYAYVVCRDTDNVVVIDTGTLGEITSIDVGLKPHGIRITPDGEYAYVSNRNDDTVSVIQTSTNTVVDTINVGDEPMSVDITPDGAYAYVCLRYGAAVDVIRISDNTVVDTIAVGDYPHGLAVSPDGEWVYVPNNDSYDVSIIRTSDNTVIATVPITDEGWEIAITPDSAYAYVTNGDHTGEEGVEVFDISTQTIIKTINLGTGTYGPRGIAIGPAIAPVGGEILPVNKLQLVAPYLLVFAIAVAGTAGILLKKRIP